MAGKVLVGSTVSFGLGLFIELLVCPNGMVAGFPQN